MEGRGGGISALRRRRKEKLKPLLFFFFFLFFVRNKYNGLRKEGGKMPSYPKGKIKKNKKINK